MYYDILMVPYEYEQVEKYFNENNYDEALKHYQLMNDHYQNADNINSLGSDGSITIIEFSETKKYPNVNEMLRKAEKMIRKLR